MILEDKIRKNIRDMEPYASARDEFNGEAEVFLDANENPFFNGVNRYPDPCQHELRKVIGSVKKVNQNRIFTGNGSDEVIDLLIRIFCNPGKDNIIIQPPTYGMYAVSAAINDVEIRKVPLTPDFQPNVKAVLDAADENSKILFICSPNNPSGNLINRQAIMQLLDGFKGLTIVDEAYIDFCPDASVVDLLAKYSNLFVMQTLSKAWGMAGLRLGIGMGNPALIRILDKIKPPYNISVLNAELAIQKLSNPRRMQEQVKILLNERDFLSGELRKLNFVRTVYPSDANFLLVKTDDACAVYHQLIKQKIVVRNRSNIILCDSCLRITVGLPDENVKLIETMKLMESFKNN